MTNPIIVLLLAASMSVIGCKHEEEHSADVEDEHQAPDEHGDRLVRVSTAAVARTGLRIEAALRTPLGGGVRIPAEVRLEPDRVVHVAPLVEGQIAEVRVSVGDRVKKGTVLALLRSVALGETRAALSEAQAELAVAKANYERQKNLVEEGIGARRNLVEADGALRTARARVAGLQSRNRVYGEGGTGSTTLLKSTIEGEIVERHATVGEVVGPNRTMFVIADTQTVWIVGAVYPQDIKAVKEGTASAFVSSDLTRRWEGTLTWVSPVIDERTRTLPVRMVLDNAERTLRPGLFGTLVVSQTGDESVVTVEDTAIAKIDGATVVFLPGEAPGTFRSHPVTTGRREDGRVEIVEGIEAGERYVASGVFVLKSQMLRGELGEGHAH